MKKICLVCRNLVVTLRRRWRNHMPVFFRRLFWSCSLISGTALAVNTAITAGGGTPHEWWQEIYPYLLGFPAGIAFAAKFTQQYHGKPIDYDQYRQAESNGRTILDRDIDILDKQENEIETDNTSLRNTKNNN